jgi:hypothetical protein
MDETFRKQAIRDAQIRLQACETQKLECLKAMNGLNITEDAKISYKGAIRQFDAQIRNAEAQIRALEADGKTN